MQFLKSRGKISIILILIFQAVYGRPEWYETKDGTRFLIENEEEYNWYDAFHECADRNLKLLAIESEEKNNALKEVIFANFHKINNLWIGGFDKFGERYDRSRPFYWIDSDVAGGKQFSYTNWAFRQPDNYKRREHCVHIWGHANTFRWNDNSCHNQEFGFICEEHNFKYGTNDGHQTEEPHDGKPHDEDEKKNNQNYNIIVTHSEDVLTEKPKDEAAYNVPDNNNLFKSLQNIQQKSEMNIIDILSNQKMYRVIRIRK